MATLARVTYVPIGSSYAGAAGGQSAGWAAATNGGDLIPISSGRGTILRAKTTAGANNVVLNNVVLSQYGNDQDITMTLAATDEQEIFIPNDGTNRFDPGPGQVNAGLLTVTYLTNPPTTLQIAAKTVG
jgi:hypothetical protein